LFLVLSPFTAAQTIEDVTDPEGVRVYRVSECRASFSAPASAASGAANLDLSRPMLWIAAVEVPQTDDVNIGDTFTVTVRGSYSVGNLTTESGQQEDGLGEIELIEGGGTLCYFSHRGIGQTVEFEISAEFQATALGDAEFRAHGIAWGEREAFPTDQKDLDTTTSLVKRVEIREPYDIEVEGPSPRVVSHDEETVAELYLVTRTQADGTVREMRLDGREGSRSSVPGVAHLGDERRQLAVSVPKVDEGCPYAPPHSPRARLTFRPEWVAIDVPLENGATYRFSRFETVGPLLAYCRPLPQPECPDGQAYDEDACECLPIPDGDRPRSRLVGVTPLDPEGDVFTTPGIEHAVTPPGGPTPPPATPTTTPPPTPTSTPGPTPTVSIPTPTPTTPPPTPTVPGPTATPTPSPTPTTPPPTATPTVTPTPTLPPTPTAVPAAACNAEGTYVATGSPGCGVVQTTVVQAGGSTITLTLPGNDSPVPFTCDGEQATATNVVVFNQGNHNCRVTVQVALPDGTVQSFELSCEQLGTSNQCQQTLGK